MPENDKSELPEFTFTVCLEFKMKVAKEVNISFINDIMVLLLIEQMKILGKLSRLVKKIREQVMLNGECDTDISSVCVKKIL